MKHKFKFTLDMGVYNGKCVHCEQDYRVKSTTQCPEAVLCEDITKRVQSGQLDFINNTWINSKLPNNTGDMARDDYVATPKQDVSESMNSFIEFMKAIEEELSPEASDELTDEDIGMLNRINRVPLPRRTVRDLVLPVDQLVSLHKLKRLDYVAGNPQTNYYEVTTKGEEFLKPKPVTLSSYAIGLLVCLSHDPQPTEDFVDDRSIDAINQLRSLSMAMRKEHSYIITHRGWGHIQKLLAVPVTIA